MQRAIGLIKGHDFKDEFSIERVVRNIDDEKKNMKNDKDRKVFFQTNYYC